MNYKESKMPILDGLAEEKRRKAYEAEAKAISNKLPELEGRISKMILTLKRIQLEILDNNSNHLRPCKCGRQWTRFDMCVICFGESK